MKSESVKCILKTFLIERENSLRYKNVASYLAEPPEYMPDCQDFSHAASAYGDCISVESIHCVQDKVNEFYTVEPQAADLPLDELNVPLDARVEILAVGVGRRLRAIAEGFDVNAVNNQANVNRVIQFKEKVIRVPPTCDCIKIPIVRTGGIGGTINVGWTTHDKSAIAGIHYVNSQGNVSFAQSEVEKTIEVEMIEDRKEKKDICFIVELYDAIGTYNTITVHVVDDSKLYNEEKHFIKNIFSCASSIPMAEIVVRLIDNVVTPNTFKAALQCVCSNADSISKEFALASELYRLTMYHAPLSSLTDAFCDFFSYLPELEDKTSVF